MSKKDDKNFIKSLKILSITTIILSVMMIVIGWFWHKNKGSDKNKEDKKDNEENKKIEDDILS